MKNLQIIIRNSANLLLLFFSVFLLNSCRDPAYNIDVLFDAAIIKYKATLLVTDANGKSLPQLTVTVAGADAANVYDFSGTKKIYAPGGIITLGLSPATEPTIEKSKTFNVIIKANGYEDVNIPVEIVNAQLSQVLNVVLRKSLENTAVTTVATKSITIDQSGKTVAETTVATLANAAVPTTLTLTIPNGTQFKNGDGEVQTGKSVNVRLVNFDQNDQLASMYFPGGKYASDNIISSASSVPSKGFFIPAASASIRMFVGSEEIRSFNQPINFKMEIAGGYIVPSTGNLVKAGDKLPVYSYQSETGRFTYESDGIVIQDGAKLFVNVSSSHLTYFVTGEFIPLKACNNTFVSYAVPWLSEGTRPVTVEISTPAGRVIDIHTTMVSNALSNVWKSLPELPLHYKIYDYNNEVLAEANFESLCSGSPLTINLAQPALPVEHITLQLNIVCPNKGIIIVPNFDLYYKNAGTTAAEYRLLGTAKKGLIKTSVLRVGSNYDFKATWGNQVKIVPNRPITSKDMSTVVGEGLDLGKNPIANNALLIEACKSLN